jgi:hypothetical protein
MSFNLKIDSTPEKSIVFKKRKRPTNIVRQALFKRRLINYSYQRFNNFLREPA